jgi:hypothetical protein
MRYGVEGAAGVQLVGRGGMEFGSRAGPVASEGGVERRVVWRPPAGAARALPPLSWPSAADPTHFREFAAGPSLVRERAPGYGREEGEDGDGGERDSAGRDAGGRSEVGRSEAGRPGAGRSGEPPSDPNPYRLRGDEPLTRAEVERIENLAAEIGTQSAELHAAEHALLVNLAEFDREEGWKHYGHRNCAAWLAFWTGLDLRTARARVRAARALEALPLASAAMRRGELSFSKVRAITRLGAMGPDQEKVVVEFALNNTAGEVEKLVRRTRFGHRKDEEEQARRRRRNRKLVMYEENGMVKFHGELELEEGAIVMRAIEVTKDAMYRQEREEPLGPEKPEPAQRRADALGLIAQLALAAGFGEGSTAAGFGDRGRAAAGPAAGPESGPAGPPETAGPPHAAAAATDTPTPVLGLIAEPYQVFLHLDPEALRNTGDPKPEHTHFEDGSRVSAETARRLCCSASVVPVVENAEGEPLSIGRRSRVHTAAIRRALWVRDRGCKFPGCGVRFTVPHHIEHWVDGGETSLDNSVLLCAFHHNAVHHDGFEVRALGGGRFRFFTPEGLPLGTEGARMLVEADDPAVALVRRNRRLGIGRPRWDAASARYSSERQIPDELLLRAWEVVDEL